MSHAADETRGGVERSTGDVKAERWAQTRKWGEQNHPDGTGPTMRPPDSAGLRCWAHAAEQAKMETDHAARVGALNWTRILWEEVAEAFAEDDPAKLRAELIQVAAVACAWAEAIDRRTDPFHPGDVVTVGNGTARYRVDYLSPPSRYSKAGASLQPMPWGTPNAAGKGTHVDVDRLVLVERATPPKPEAS